MLTDRLQVTRVSQSILTMIYRTFSIFGSRLPGSPADYIGGLRDSGSQHSIIPASFFGRTVFKGQFPSVLLTFRIAVQIRTSLCSERFQNDFRQTLRLVA